MAAVTPSPTNPIREAFHDLVRDKGRNVPVSEFLKGDALAANVMFSHEGGARASEWAIERAMLTVARECPKACSGCGAMEVTGRQESSAMNHESRIAVSARCTSAGYCPRATVPVRIGLEDFEREYMTAVTAATPYAPTWLGEMQDVANKVLAEKRYLKPKEAPSSAPKTKAPLVW